MSVALVSSADCGRHDTGWGHPEHPGRLRGLPAALRTDPELLARLHYVDARHATEDELSLAHGRRYIERIKAVVAAGGGQLDGDTVASEGSWDAATASAGAVLEALDLTFGDEQGPRRAFCAVRPPGHHALRDAAMGFCLFGNVAIGAHYARRRHGAERVLIVDWDVHHGNGTQALVGAGSRHPLRVDAPMAMVSRHRCRRGSWTARQRLERADAAGLAPQRYVDAFQAAVDGATAGFTPDLVLISAGFDSLARRPTRRLHSRVRSRRGSSPATSSSTPRVWCGGRVVSALEGGYDPARLAEACVVHMRALE